MENNLTEAQQQYLSDEMYTPIYYKGVVHQEPKFKGVGNHSIAELEQICLEYENFCEQQKVIKEHTKVIIVNEKFGLKLKYEN